MHTKCLLALADRPRLWVAIIITKHSSPRRRESCDCWSCLRRVVSEASEPPIAGEWRAKLRVDRNRPFPGTSKKNPWHCSHLFSSPTRPRPTPIAAIATPFSDPLFSSLARLSKPLRCVTEASSTPATQKPCAATQSTVISKRRSRALSKSSIVVTATFKRLTSALSRIVRLSHTYAILAANVDVNR